MGFGAYARSAGVERLVSREDYEDRHGKGDFDGYWGIWDEPFLQFTGEELSRTPEPFFAMVSVASDRCNKCWHAWGREPLAVGFLRGARIEFLQLDTVGTATKTTTVVDFPSQLMLR